MPDLITYEDVGFQVHVFAQKEIPQFLHFSKYVINFQIIQILITDMNMINVKVLCAFQETSCYTLTRNAVLLRGPLLIFHTKHGLGKTKKGCL